MRLIDADAFIEFEEKAWDGSVVEVRPTSLYHIILDDIRDAKTIDAIPVSWIKSYALRTGKVMAFIEMFDEWRRINGEENS